MRAVDRAMGWLTWILQAGGALVLVFMMISELLNWAEVRSSA